MKDVKRCEYCKHKEKRLEGYWCSKNHYYPNQIVIWTMGCSDFSRSHEQLSLFRKEVNE